MTKTWAPGNHSTIFSQLPHLVQEIQLAHAVWVSPRNSYDCLFTIICVTSSPTDSLYILKISRNLLEDHWIAPNHKTSGYHHIVISFVICSLSLLPISHPEPSWKSSLKFKRQPSFLNSNQYCPNKGSFFFGAALLVEPNIL